ncbi:MAG TPA: hypothetical protein VE954_13545 [Oligoflexus sp.]|uniref:hypothetical protein n=1 Tax=Oligoflexus sp. TaxID=1971216 RepID=UPI002D2269E7|nr:hypothetical protein [Oligoflexus sp.]HYX34127.1 hypothetical protein [Oligoflexus sp.]
MTYDYWDKIRTNSSSSTGSIVKANIGDLELFSFKHTNPGMIILPPRRDPALVKLHYIVRDSGYDPDYVDAGYFRCGGSDCVYCDHISKGSEFLLLPVYSVADAKIHILHFKPTDEEGGIGLIVAEAYRRKADDRKEVLVIKQVRTESNKYRYIANASEEQVEGEGDREMSEFLKDLNDGTILIEEVFPSYSNEDLLGGIEKLRRLHARAFAKSKPKVQPAQTERRRAGGKPMAPIPPEREDDDAL